MEKHSNKGQHKKKEKAAAEQEADQEAHPEGGGSEVKQGTNRDEMAMPGVRGHVHLQRIVDNSKPS